MSGQVPLIATAGDFALEVARDRWLHGGGPIGRCYEPLSDTDGFAAVCAQPLGSEHSHHDHTARSAVAAGLAWEGCYDCAGLDDDPDRDACSNCDRLFRKAAAP